MFVFAGLFIGYVALIIADLVLYYFLQKRVDLLESRLLTLELTEDSEEYEEWTTTLNSQSRSS